MADISKILFYNVGRPKQFDNANDVLKLNNVTVDQLLQAANVSVTGDLTVSGDITSSSSTNIVTGDQFIDLNASADGTSKSGGLVVIHNKVDDAITLSDASASISSNTITFGAGITEASATLTIVNGHLNYNSNDTITLKSPDKATSDTIKDTTVAAYMTAIAALPYVASAVQSTNDILITFVAGYRYNKVVVESLRVNNAPVGSPPSPSGGVGFINDDGILLQDFDLDGFPANNGIYKVASIAKTGGTQDSITITTSAVSGAHFIQTSLSDMSADDLNDSKIKTFAMTAIAVADGTGIQDAGSNPIAKGTFCNLRMTEFAVFGTATIENYEVSNVGLQDVYNVGNSITLASGSDLLVSKPSSGNASISLGANAKSDFTVEGDELVLQTSIDAGSGNSGALSVLPSDKGAQYGFKEFVHLNNELYPLELQANLVAGDLVKITVSQSPSVTLTIGGGSGAAVGVGASFTLSVIDDVSGTEETFTFTEGTDFNAGANASDSADSLKTAIEGETLALAGSSLFVEKLVNGSDFDLRISHEGVGALGNTTDGANAVTGTNISISGSDLSGGSNAKVEKAQANNYDNCKGLLGFCLNGTSGTPSNGDSVHIAGAGSLLETGGPSVSYGDMGKPIYLSASTAGEMSIQDPAGSGECVFQVGVAVGVNQLLVMPQFIAELP